MSFSSREIDSAWAKLQMGPVDKKRDLFAYLFHEGVLVLHTRRSRGRGKIPDWMADRIRQQMRLDDAQFRDAINCPLRRPDYIQILTEKGLIVPRSETP